MCASVIDAIAVQYWSCKHRRCESICFRWRFYASKLRCGWYSSMISHHQWKQCQKEMVKKKLIWLAYQSCFCAGADIDADSKERITRYQTRREGAKKKINRLSHYWFCFLKDFTSFPSGERLRCFHLNDHDDDFFQRFLHLWRVFLIGNLLICSEGRKTNQKLNKKSVKWPWKLHVFTGNVLKTLTEKHLNVVLCYMHHLCHVKCWKCFMLADRQPSGL